MDWKESAPWVMVGIAVIGQVAHVAVAQWRIGALDEWRKDVDGDIDRLEQDAATAASERRALEHRIERIERIQDDR